MTQAMTKDDIRSILKTLLQKSKAKQVTWTLFADSEIGDSEPGLENDYIVSFPRSSVNVFKNPEDGSIGVNILNSAGKVVGSLGNKESGSDTPLLQELLSCARESVFMIDETLEDLRKALGQRY